MYLTYKFVRSGLTGTLFIKIFVKIDISKSFKFLKLIE